MFLYWNKLLLFCVFGLLLLFGMGGTEAKAQTTVTCPGGPTITFPSTICAGDNCGAGTPFTVSGDTVGITKYKWDFGDTSTDADTSSLKYPSYQYEAAGQFNGTLTITRNGVEQSCPFTVNVQQGVPEFDITPDDNLGPQDEEICLNSSATLTPKFRDNQQAPAGATYLWSTGQTTSTLTVPDTVGCYSLTITDPATGCSTSQKINITVYKPDPNNPPPPKEESRWYFGNGAGIKFVGGNPEAITGNINAPEGVSAVSGSTGQLLFYTDGRNVFDKSGAPMKDRNGLNVTVADNNPLGGGANATQGVLIIAQPGCNACDPVYYVFTTSDIGPNGSQLSYSVVDMRLNNGLGQVTLKNVPLFSTSTERVVGVRGQADPNNQNAQETTWIITHDFNTNTFRVYPLTTQGIGQSKTYNVGAAHGPETVKGESYMKVYDDKIVVTIPGANGSPNVVQIFEFDNTTGEVKANPLTITLGPVPPAAPLYGVELNGDSTLYVSTRGTGATAPSKLIQLDLRSWNPDTIVKYQVVLDSSLTESWGALQADPNGQKIYLAKENSNSLGVINSPSTIGKGADFQPNGFALTGGQSKLGLPNTQPPNNQGYGQGFSFDPPACTPPNTPTQVTFRAQPDRAGGDPTKSTYLWRFPNGVTYVTDSVQHTFPGPGTYTVGLTIYNDCKPEGEVIPDQQIVIPVAPPPVTLRDTSACAGATVRLEAYPGQPGPTGVTYTWALPNGSSRTGKAIDVTVADVTASNSTFRVIVANDTCSQSASAQVNFIQIRDNLGNDTTLCQINTLLLNAGNPGMQYAWTWTENGQSRTASTQTISVRPSATTTYSVTITDPLTKCSDTHQKVVTIGAKPQVSVDTTPASGCTTDDGSLTINFASPGPNTFSLIRQSDGQPIISNETTSQTTRDFPGGLTAGAYQVTVRNTSGCDTTILADIGLPDGVGPSIQPIAPVELNCDGEGIIFPLVSHPTGLGFTYEWKNAANQTVGTDDRLEASPAIGPGVYSLTVTDSDGCRATAIAEFKQNPNSTQVSVAAIETGCGQFLLRAALTGTNTNPQNFNFKWEGPGLSGDSELGRDTITVRGGENETLRYTVTVTSTKDAACITSAPRDVVFPDVPDFNAGPDLGPACAPNVILINLPQNAYWDTYIWTLPGGTTYTGRQYTATTGGTYRITARNSITGCTANDEVNVTINPQPAAPTVTNPAPFCASTSTGGVPQLTAQGQNLRWYANPNLTRPLTAQNTPAFLPPVNPNQPGAYTYFVTQTVNGCESRPAAITLTIGLSPQIELGADRNVCQGETVVLNATPRNVSGPVTYLWESGLTTPTINATRTGTYRVTVTMGGCSVPDEVTLTFVAPPQTSIPRREVPMCTQDGETTATLDAGPGTNLTYEWRRAGSNSVIGTTRTITVSNLGAYTIAISNGGSCVVNDTIRVVDKCEPRIFVPDAFTPNADAVNNVLEVKGKHVGQIEMLIYNRWGELIHTNKGANLEEISSRFWDGTYLGKPAATGTYVWKITYRSEDYPDRDPIILRGGVLLMR